MDEDEVLRCLAEAESGRLRPELCGGRYVAVAYDIDGTDDEDAFEDEADEGFENVRVLGEVSSVYEAFDLLMAEMADDAEAKKALGAAGLPLVDDDRDGDLLDEGQGDDQGDGQGGGQDGDRNNDLDDDDPDDDPDDEFDDDRGAPALPGITSPARRYLAYTALSWTAPMDLVTSSHHESYYLGHAPALFDGARFRFLCSAAPPHHEEAWAILELQPTGEPSDADRALMTASALGDTEAISAALTANADVNALDEHGMTALHAAVAHRRPGAVTALLAAGADPARQAEFGNAPHFAGLDHRQRVRSCADRLDGAEHMAVIRSLLDSGAPVDAHDRDGATLIDLALNTLPYPAELVSLLVDRSASSGLLGNRTLGHLLDRLPYRDPRALRTHVNKVRFLLDAGADPNAAENDGAVFTHRRPALHALLTGTVYYAHEVPGEVLAALVDELLRHGARDVPYRGETVLEQVEHRLDDERFQNYRPVADRLRATATEQQAR
ncbi:ankyrin repeat domain-containing protein [Streptomyces sp. 8N114]|uniref:ankyrin repeat domain-containing protein n=1 Tax=Streptomyces sp. 8N114 TaxID=3457419 RepID=UPI003FD29ED7